MNIETKKALLNSAISGELGQMKGKMDFWQLDCPEAGTIWQAEKPLSLEEVLGMFEDEKEVEGTELGTLLGIGWEFVWGQKPPEEVCEMRKMVRMKARCGLEMTELEKLWFQLIAVDTDMF